MQSEDTKDGVFDKDMFKSVLFIFVIKFVPSNLCPKSVPKIRPKKKGQKKVGKKGEIQSLVGLHNDPLGRLEPPISIPQMMQRKKLGKALIDMLAWSAAMCKEREVCILESQRRK